MIIMIIIVVVIIIMLTIMINIIITIIITMIQHDNNKDTNKDNKGHTHIVITSNTASRHVSPTLSGHAEGCWRSEWEGLIRPHPSAFKLRLASRFMER